MWAEILPKVKHKFQALRERGWGGFVDADQQHFEKLSELYELITWEMVEGMSTLFLQVIQNQNYIAKNIPGIETHIYQQAHGSIYGKLEECLEEEVATIPQFYMHIREAIDQLHGYCKLLKQDIRARYQRYKHLEHDRKFRQINLTLREMMDGFERLDDRNALLLKVVGEGQTESSLALIGAGGPYLDDVLGEDLFSEEEMALLKKMLDDGE